LAPELMGTYIRGGANIGHRNALVLRPGQGRVDRDHIVCIVHTDNPGSLRCPDDLDLVPLDPFDPPAVHKVSGIGHRKRHPCAAVGSYGR